MFKSSSRAATVSTRGKKKMVQWESLILFSWTLRPTTLPPIFYFVYSYNTLVNFTLTCVRRWKAYLHVASFHTKRHLLTFFDSDPTCFSARLHTRKSAVWAGPAAVLLWNRKPWNGVPDRSRRCVALPTFPTQFRMLIRLWTIIHYFLFFFALKGLLKMSRIWTNSSLRRLSLLFLVSAGLHCAGSVFMCVCVRCVKCWTAANGHFAVSGAH